jgi:hypothetical protein
VVRDLRAHGPGRLSPASGLLGRRGPRELQSTSHGQPTPLSLSFKGMGLPARRAGAGGPPPRGPVRRTGSASRQADATPASVRPIRKTPRATAGGRADQRAGLAASVEVSETPRARPVRSRRWPNRSALRPEPAGAPGSARRASIEGSGGFPGPWLLVGRRSSRAPRSHARTVEVTDSDPSRLRSQPGSRDEPRPAHGAATPCGAGRRRERVQQRPPPWALSRGRRAGWSRGVLLRGAPAP